MTAAIWEAAATAPHVAGGALREEALLHTPHHPAAQHHTTAPRRGQPFVTQYQQAQQTGGQGPNGVGGASHCAGSANGTSACPSVRPEGAVLGHRSPWRRRPLATVAMEGTVSAVAQP
jgi:hypothetical protein